MRNYLSILLLAVAGTATAQPPPPEPTPPEPPPPVEPAPPAVDPPMAEEKEKKPTAGYDKGFFLRSDDGRYSMKIEARVHAFYTLTRTDEPKDYLHAFEIRRARLTLGGNAHTKRLRYKFQTDYGKGFVTLKDFHADVELANDVWLRAGQWKRPFSRQHINSSGRLELTDRAITDKAFGAGRDIGIAIRNDYEKSPDLEWTVGVFNGTGDGAKATSVTVIDPMTGAATTTTSLPTNVPKKFKPALVARVGINRNGLEGYQEGDLEGGPLRFGVGASVWLEGDYDDKDEAKQKAELDYIVKAEGFSTTGGIYAQTAQDGDNFLDQAQSLWGFHLQAGYMLVPKRWQVAARYALVNDWTTADTSAADQQEISVGASYYGFGHAAKIAGALRFVKVGDGGFADAVLFELGTNLVF